MLDIAAAYLKNKGHLVEIETKGRNGLARILEIPPDILVVKSILPDLDGFQIIDQVLKRISKEEIVIILLTSIAADGEPLRDWSMPIDS